jgi:hypothetical protein
VRPAWPGVTARTILGMELTRQWMSQSLRASGVSLAIPFTALVAAALVAAGGGGLDSLGQLASGPTPPASLDQFAGDQSATAEATVAGPASVGGGGSAGTAGAGTTAPTTGGPSGGGGPSGRTPTSTGPGGGRPSAPQAPPSPVATSPGGSSPTPGPSQTGAAEQLGNTVKGVTNGAPQPVRDTVDRLIDPVVGTCKQAGCP